MEISQALEHSQPGLVKRITTAMREHHLNHRSEQTYMHWIFRFVLYHNLKTTDALENEDRQRFLDYLVREVQVSRARLNQAKQALTFLYSDVLQRQESEGVTAAV